MNAHAPVRPCLPFLAAVLLAACKGSAPAPAAPPPPQVAASASASPTPSATAPEAPAPTTDAAKDTSPEELAGIVARYRQNIVLAADEASLDEETRDRIAIVGRMLFDENLQALATLRERLVGALKDPAHAATGPRALPAFLDWLEKDADLHDADKLAFKDTLADLRDAVAALPGSLAWKAPLLTRVEEDQRALQDIQARYEKELQAIFGRFETRGMAVRREAWEAYLAFLKGRFTREAILQSFAPTLQPLDEGATRGKKPRKQEDPTIITGNSLPPKKLVHTFDDGPHPRFTPSILATLEKFGVKSIFFEVGQNVGVPGTKDTDAGTLTRTEASTYSEQILASGHVLANHSLTHAFLPKLSDQRLDKEIDESKRIIEQVTSSHIALFRPPYGARNEKVAAALAARNLKAYLWNVDALDWSDPIPTSIANRVVQQVDALGRGVILLHDVHSQTTEALPLILETLQSRGYRFVLWDGTRFLGGTSDGDGGTPAVPAPTPPANLYRESWAVVIGINDYQKWPKLSYAVNDAEGMRELLVRKYHFKPENVTVLLDGQATRERILSVLGDALTDSEQVKRDDRVFVFFAGHGVTRRLPNGKSLGYIVPVDADTSNYQSTAISMTNFQDISEAISAKHVFFVMDACYSGLALTRGGAPGGDVRKYLQEVTRRSARQVLTAGGADEQVADQGPNGHSIFTWTLLQGLEGQADLNTDGFVTASELAAYVGPTVSSLSRQTPAFGNMPGSEGGEFVLELNHDSEFLSEDSAQLDAQAIQLNAELEKVRKEIAEKQLRNESLARELAAAKNQLAQLQDAGTVVAVAPPTPAPSPAEEAKRRNDRGMVLYRERRYPEALAEFQAAAQLDPKDAQAANNVGFVLFKQGQYAESVKWLEKTLTLDAQRAVAYINLGDAYDKLGQRAEAAKAYERYLVLMPGGPTAPSVKEKLAKLRP